TLYQLVSGHDPASSPFKLLPLRSLMPTAPAELEPLLTQMLELDEDKRPANILIVKQKLQAVASAISSKDVFQKPNQPGPVVPTPVALPPTSSSPHNVQQNAATPARPLAPTQVATPKPSSTGQLS